jgi:hypothetical protein
VDGRIKSGHDEHEVSLKKSQHPLQMLGIRPSSLSFSRTAARSTVRRGRFEPNRFRLNFAMRCAGSAR